MYRVRGDWGITRADQHVRETQDLATGVLQGHYTFMYILRPCCSWGGPKFETYEVREQGVVRIDSVYLVHGNTYGNCNGVESTKYPARQYAVRR